MNYVLLNQYDIKFYRRANNFIDVSAASPNLSIFMQRLANYKPELEDFTHALNNAISGQYNSIEQTQWNIELGFNIYTGIIKEDMTFDLFMEDYYNETLETYPIDDIKEIFGSLMQFIE